MTIANIVLVLATLTTGLTAGLFFSWTVAVMPGFARLPDKEFLSAMQATNRAIQNPFFFAAFFGAPLLLTICTILHYGETRRFPLLLAATVVYLTGTFGVTIFGNVPMNNRLDRFDLSKASETETAGERAIFENRWNYLNTIRTVTSTIALILVIISFLN